MDYSVGAYFRCEVRELGIYFYLVSWTSEFACTEGKEKHMVG